MAQPSASETTETNAQFMEREYAELRQGDYDGSVEQFQKMCKLIEAIGIQGWMTEFEKKEIRDTLGQMEAIRALYHSHVVREGKLFEKECQLSAIYNDDNEWDDYKCDDKASGENECYDNVPCDNECDDNASGENECDETPISLNGWCPLANTTTGCTNSEECPYKHPTRACTRLRKGNCAYGKTCTFAHFCVHYKRFGYCKFGSRCVYRHH